ncbi:hypothetical protein TWF718_000272 [Orbilia javanica]|uniref:Uncharacterized protein n=1 Tax=Orbilia javanica TaxID=47235 RepID=A0AAN8MZF3_9PEZI
MHHGFRHPEAHMETLTMLLPTPTPTLSIATTISVPATIPQHLDPEPTRRYLDGNLRGDCFPVEPLSTEYKNQCYVPIFNQTLINDKIAQSLIPCCYGRLDVVEGCGYQCISNFTEDHGDHGGDPRYKAPIKWWSECLSKSPLPEEPENPPADWTLEVGIAMCVDRPRSSMVGVRASVEQKLLTVMLLVGVVLPLVMI